MSPGSFGKSGTPKKPIYIILDSDEEEVDQENEKAQVDIKLSPPVTPCQEENSRQTAILHIIKQKGLLQGCCEHREKSGTQKKPIYIILDSDGEEVDQENEIEAQVDIKLSPPVTPCQEENSRQTAILHMIKQKGLLQGCCEHRENSGTQKKPVYMILDSDGEEVDQENEIEAQVDIKLSPLVTPCQGENSRQTAIPYSIKQKGLQQGRCEQKAKRKSDNYSELATDRVDKKRVAVFSSTSIPRTRGPNHCYVSLPDELEENDQLQIFNEDPEDDINDNKVPCRTLDNYTIFDIKNKQRIVSWELIGEANRDVRFVGEVKAIFNNSSNDDDDDERELESEEGNDMQGPGVQRVRSSAIFSWQDDVTQGGCEIWLLTQYGWYKLQKPSEQMAPLVSPVLRQLNLASIVTHTLQKDPFIEWKVFLESIKSCPSIFSYSVPEYKYTMEDIKKFSGLLNNDIEAWMEFCLESGIELHNNISEAPLLKKIQYLAGCGRKFGIGQNSGRRTVRNTIPKNSKEGNPTIVTPWINKIAAGLYAKIMIVTAGENQRGGVEANKEKNDDGNVLTYDILEGRSFKRKIEWVGGEIWRDGLGGERVGYGQVNIDGENIKPGDYVSIRPGSGERLNRKEGTGSLEGSKRQQTWFAKIIYLFQNDEGEKCAHMRWLTHGTGTILGEISTPKELFLTTICDESLLGIVVGKIEVSRLWYGQPEPEGSEGNMFYRYWYDQDKAIFEDPSKHENFRFPDSYAIYEKCDSCEEVRRAEAFGEIEFCESGDTCGFSYKGVFYRIGDFVYCIPTVADVPYRIGQIKQIGLMSSSSPSSSGSRKNIATVPGVKVRLLKRYDELIRTDFKTELADGQPIVRDSRQLFFTKKEVQVPATEIEGKCFVLHNDHIEDLNAWKDQEDTFWYNSCVAVETGARMGLLRDICKKEVRVCKETMLEKEKKDEILEYFEHHGKKLRGMDIFAGAGGLTIGLDKGGAVKTCWAIEFAASPAISFKHNMPDVIVYNQCANILLDRAIKEYEGKTLEDLIDFQGNVTPAMPHKGEVDFIYGGPPCQGFSAMNRFKKENDIRNTLIANFLSYVDFYRPDYCLLENVKGLLNHKFGDIRMGTVKLIFRALTSMGYQVRLDLLQAGQYGVPQTRRRVIFWGTKLGIEIPSFPRPTHCFPKTSGVITLPDGRVLTNDGMGSYAPHPPVLIGDALVDLPGFEYVNPRNVYAATIHDKAEDARRPWTKYDIALQRSHKRDCVGLKKQAYLYPPLTEYQRSLRSKVGEDELTGHYVRTFNILNTERICSVGLGVGSDHRSLPDDLKPWCLSHPDSKAAANGMYPGAYGRLDPDGVFQTVVTRMDPGGKPGTVLHPNQHRVLSVREHARSQGFPDSYLFFSSVNNTKELYKQIGNAVPIQLAEVLGRRLRDVVIERQVKEGILSRV